MKIVLKDADFSQSGIPTPHEVVFDGTKYLNVFTGALEDNSNVKRGADVAMIPMSNNRLNNNSATAVLLEILFYDSQNNCLGMVSVDGTTPSIVLAANESIRIDQEAHYTKYSGSGTSFVEMTQSEVTQMFAEAAYWRIAAQNDTDISAVAVTLEIE